MNVRQILALVILECSCLMAGAFPQKPAVEGPVNDLAGLLSASQVLELQHLLVDFADSTSNQICVVTVNSLEGMEASQFAIQIGLDWKVGDKDFNNGIVFLVKPRIGNESGDVFIAVGRGLEGAIPDIYAHRIVNDVVIPYLADGDYYNGIKEGCLKLMQYASGEYHEAYQEEEVDELMEALIAILIISFIVMIIFLIGLGNDRDGGNNGQGGNGGGGRRSDTPFIFVSPGRSSRGGSSGGSFGGGGFSGGFSGGFGGGSFGGGGAGGKF